MGLRCLLGHDFGEPEVEREREEEGNEMVATIREVKTCQRCGERQVVSENKEVTSIRSAEEVGIDEDESDPEPTHPAVDADDADEAFEPPADADEDDGVILDEEPPERDPGEWPDHDDEVTPTASAGGGAGADDAAGGLGVDEVATEDEISRAGERPAEDDAVEDDAEFIDADDGEATGVAWPEHEDPNDAAAEGTDADAGGPTPWPEHEGEDEGYEARPASEAGDDDHGVTFGSGFTPEASNGDGEVSEATHDAGGGTGVAAETRSESRAEGFDAEFVGGPDTTTDTGEEFARAESESVELETEMEGVPTEYFCPNCGYTREGTGSSMRAGDICPECRRGYMAEREA